MKATININGTLIINSENEIEEYSLRKWIEENYEVKGIDIMLPSFNCNGTFDTSVKRALNIEIIAKRR